MMYLYIFIQLTAFKFLFIYYLHQAQSNKLNGPPQLTRSIELSQGVLDIR